MASASVDFNVNVSELSATVIVALAEDVIAPATSTAPEKSPVAASTSPVTVIESTKVSLKRREVVPRSTSLSVTGDTAPSLIVIWSVPATLISI